MEGVAAAASIIAVIDISAKVIGVCKHYVETVKDAPRDFKRILVEVSALNGLFDALKIINATSDIYNSDAALLDPIKLCAEAVHDLELLLPCDVGVTPPAGRGPNRASRLPTLSTLCWPLNESQAKKLLDQISRCKSTISVALQTEAVVGISRIELKLCADERRRILEWLALVDPSMQHNRARDLHEKHTGAGKTILASFMIEQLKKRANREIAVCYYYCFHVRNADESDNFIARVLSTLCSLSGHIPHEIQTCYERQDRPTTEESFSALASLMDRFKTVFIAIDAVDESHNRERLLNILRTLVQDQRFSKARVVITSRDEVDIRAYISPIGAQLSMANSYVHEDIRKYVQHEIFHRNNPRLSHWSSEVKQEVVEALAKGAKGMFRWAACQVQILQRLRHISAIRTALTQLPETLDETYERILSSIPTKSTSLVCRALWYLCTARQDYSLDVIRFVSTLRCDPSLEQSARDSLNFAELEEACVCLIVSVSADDDPYGYDNDEAMIAHYTVREYLMSERIKQSRAACYSLTPDKAMRLPVEMALNAVPGPFPKCSRYHLFSLQALLRQYTEEYVAEGWLDLLDRIVSLASPYNEKAIKLEELSGPDDTLVWERNNSAPHTSLDFVELPICVPAAVIWQLSTLRFETVAIAYISRLSPGEASEALNETLRTGLQTAGLVSLLTIKSILGFTGSDSILRNLLERADHVPDGPNTLTNIMPSLIHDSPDKADEWLLSLLPGWLDKGLGVNPQGAQLTPLQIAVAMRWTVAVKFLLEAGADPNIAGVSSGAPLDGCLPLFHGIRALSPLYIVRNRFEDLHTQKILPLHHGTAKEIESLLLQYGAEEFQEPGPFPEYARVDKFLKSRDAWLHPPVAGS